MKEGDRRMILRYFPAFSLLFVFHDLGIKYYADGLCRTEFDGVCRQWFSGVNTIKVAVCILTHNYLWSVSTYLWIHILWIMMSIYLILVAYMGEFFPLSWFYFIGLSYTICCHSVPWSRQFEKGQKVRC